MEQSHWQFLRPFSRPAMNWLSKEGLNRPAGRGMHLQGWGRGLHILSAGPLGSGFKVCGAGQGSASLPGEAPVIQVVNTWKLGPGALHRCFAEAMYFCGD